MVQLMARMPKLAHLSSRICMCKGWPNYYIKCGEKGVPPHGSPKRHKKHELADPPCMPDVSLSPVTFLNISAEP